MRAGGRIGGSLGDVMALLHEITNISAGTKVPPRCRRQSVADRPHDQGHCTNREVRTVRKTLIALAATTGLIGLSSIGASAATMIPAPAVGQASAVQQADWGYCDRRCQYWQHQRWEARREWRHREWREHHNPYYGYNYNRGYYR
jgi:hypothetical protein